MEKISLITTIILAIMAFSFERLRILIKISLSATIAFYLLSLFYDNIVLWEESQYTISHINILIKSTIPTTYVILTVLVYAIFYVIIYHTIIYLFDKRMIKVYNNTYGKMSNKELRRFDAFILRFSKKYIRFINSNLNVKFKNDSTFEYTKMRNDVISLMCFAVHVLACIVVIGFNISTIIVGFIVTIILIAMVLIIMIIGRRVLNLMKLVLSKQLL